MTTVAELAAWLEGFAPSRLAELWDNVGLLWGDPSDPVARVMTCLTVTPRTADEAIAGGAAAIVSHHPILFKPIKTLRTDRPESAMLWRLARAGVAILSPHTAFDNTNGGINDGLASRLGLSEVGPIRPAANSARFKVVVFAPRSDREAVMLASFRAGAGEIGEYRECSFGSPGFGTFLGGENSNPTIGEAGRRETVREWRLEFVCPGDRLRAVLAAIREAHSYEEPAIDAIPLTSGPPVDPGAGRIGRLEPAEPLGQLAARVAHLLDAPATQFVGDSGRIVSRVAICCGAGDDFLTDAIRLGADVLLTGEARFHRALEAEAHGIGLIVAGHHATERPGVEDLARRLGQAFPGVETWASRAEADPLTLARAVPDPGPR
ncbi:Nif3-like dinuclear metal center hexameric protein [Tundrisphaera sp. TA3]|uniref:Nif3-like dinuclear metal center hexameric protein n=1 Tax=Tundrisphaera sp. TA3 TaxID=3435775 RepID=UPI003EBBAC1A